MESNLSNSGTLDISGTIICQTNTDIKKRVRHMRFYNPAAYVLTVNIYHAEMATTVILYKKTLNAEDTLDDTYEYLLEPGDKITAISDIAGTEFHLSGEQISHIKNR